MATSPQHSQDVDSEHVVVGAELECMLSSRAGSGWPGCSRDCASAFSANDALRELKAQG